MFPIHFSNSISSGTCLLFSAYVPPVCKIMIPDGLTRCIYWQAESKNSCACLHMRFARRRNGRREFKSKFGVRSWVHLSVHLRSVMRSVESFSREKHLITPSALQAPVAFKKEEKSLFSQGSEGKVITTDTRERLGSTGQDRNTQGASLREADALMQTCACHPLSSHHTFVFQFKCKQVVTLWTFLFFCGGCSAKSAADSAYKSSALQLMRKTLRCEKWFVIVTFLWISFLKSFNPKKKKNKLHSTFKAEHNVGGQH